MTHRLKDGVDNSIFAFRIINTLKQIFSFRYPRYYECARTEYTKDKEQAEKNRDRDRDHKGENARGVLWHEGICGRNDEDVASAFYKVIALPENDHIKKWTVWLDNCSGQNKCWTFHSWPHVYVSRQFPQRGEKGNEGDEQRL